MMAAGETHWPDELFTDLDRTGPVPLYYQVSSRLEAAIHSGAIPAGARLENEIAIAQKLGLSRPTVRRAIQELVDKGLLVRRRASAPRWSRAQVTRQVELTSLYEDLQNASHTPGTRVLAHEIVPATDAVATGLGIPPGTRCRVPSPAAHRPTECLWRCWRTICRRIRRHHDRAARTRGLYQVLRARGVTIRVAKQKIGARRAHRRRERACSTSTRAVPCSPMERIAFDDSGRAFEYGHHCYRPDMYSFETTLVAK